MLAHQRRQRLGERSVRLRGVRGMSRRERSRAPRSVSAARLFLADCGAGVDRGVASLRCRPRSVLVEAKPSEGGVRWVRSPACQRPELRRQIVERLAAAQATAPLSRRLVRDAAAACGVSERHDVAVDRAWRPARRARRGAWSRASGRWSCCCSGAGTSPRCTASFATRARRCRRGRRWGGRLSGR